MKEMKKEEKHSRLFFFFLLLSWFNQEFDHIGPIYDTSAKIFVVLFFFFISFSSVMYLIDGEPKGHEQEVLPFFTLFWVGVVALFPSDCGQNGLPTAGPGGSHSPAELLSSQRAARETQRCL